MSNIEWTDATWNPVTGCRHAGPGCLHCYAETMSKRLAAMGQAKYQGVIDEKGRFNGRALTWPDELAKPLGWKKPRMVFVNSMSDLFHEDVPFEFIAAVFGVMAACPQHTFQVLTKRPERALTFFEWVRTAPLSEPFERGGKMFNVPRELTVCGMQLEAEGETEADRDTVGNIYELAGAVAAPNKPVWPLHNVWLGVSIACQPDVAKLVTLIKCHAAVRFVSAEPLIDAIDLRQFMPCLRCDNSGSEPRDGGGKPCGGCFDYAQGGPSVGPFLDWVIVGGESGPGARPFDVAWARSIVKQCKTAGVPVFVKQLGAAPEIDYYCEDDHLREWAINLDGDAHVEEGFQPAITERLKPRLKDKKGGDPSEWPEDLRVREFPKQEPAHA